MKVFHLSIYSHFFKLTKIQHRAVPCINQFCRQYGLKQWVKENGRAQLKITRVFAVRTKNAREYRFHIGQLDAFYKALKNDHIIESMYTTEIIPLYTPTEIQPTVRPGWVLRDYQEEAKAFILDETTDDNHSRLVAMPTGTGKAQPLSTPIKIPNGWSTMGNMKVGTEIIAKDGTITSVTAIHPQPLKPVYKVIFQDGRYTYCCYEHLWKVWVTLENEKPIEMVLTLGDILMKYLNRLGCKVSIPLCVSERNDDVEFIIDPEVMGQMVLKGQLLPKIYLNGSTSQREVLLKSLLAVEELVSDVYTITSNYIAGQVGYLVRSLGGMMLSFDGTHLYTIALSGDVSTLQIQDIRYDRLDYTQCISIAHPDQLYITDNFIVTHNTATAIITTSNLKHRVMIVVLSGYVDKWIADIEKTIECQKGDIIAVQGSKSLKDLTYSENTAKYIIVSLNTIKNYFKLYEDQPDSMETAGYAYPPEDLCRQLDIGVIIIDEVHQHLHAVYKLLTYTHVPKVIALSATLISDDPLIQQIQHQMFPKEIRFDKVAMDQYIQCYATSYFFNDMTKEKIRTTEFGSNVYSHNAFEKSLLKRPHVVNNYVKMLNNLIYNGYIQHYQRGDKLAVYVSSIAMADYVTDWLKRKYPDMDVRRYVEQDPYENVIDADIRVTTVLSAGTAIDIPNLICVVMTINMKSSVFNLQTLGRLRKIEGRKVKFYWVYCNQCAKHYEFHEHRKMIFQDRVESIKELHYPYGL